MKDTDKQDEDEAHHLSLVSNPRSNPTGLAARPLASLQRQQRRMGFKNPVQCRRAGCAHRLRDDVAGTLEGMGERLELGRGEPQYGNRNCNMVIPGQRHQLLLEAGAVRSRLPKLLFGFVGPPHIRFEQRCRAEQILRVGPVRHEVRKSVQKS